LAESIVNATVMSGTLHTVAVGRGVYHSIQILLDLCRQTLATKHKGVWDATCLWAQTIRQPLQARESPDEKSSIRLK